MEEIGNQGNFQKNQQFNFNGNSNNNMNFQQGQIKTQFNFPDNNNFHQIIIYKRILIINLIRIVIL